MNAKVRNMTNSNGNTVANQFIIEEEGRGALGNFTLRETFQSYDSVIAVKTTWPDGQIDIKLDANSWDYSTTTGKYRNQFLGENKKETQAKINSGEYHLTNLNRN